MTISFYPVGLSNQAHNKLGSVLRTPNAYRKTMNYKYALSFSSRHPKPIIIVGKTVGKDF